MSSTPMRVTAGFTQDAPFQPLGLIGQPDPFFYATFFDDFMSYLIGEYTVTVNTNGTVAAVAGGVNGRMLFTTNASTPLAADIAELQTIAATIVLSATKKTAFLCRMQAASSSAPVFQLGLIQSTATPATITDGMVATRAHSATGWVFSMYKGSAVVGTVTVPDTVSGYAADTDIDIGMVYNGRGDVLCYMGAGLIGQNLNQNTAVLGPVARFTPTSLPTVALAPTLAMQSGAAASTTATFDLLYAAQER